MLNVQPDTKERRQIKEVYLYRPNQPMQKEKCRMGARKSFPQGTITTEKAILVDAINSEVLGNIKCNHYFLFQFYSPTLAEKVTFPCPVPPKYQWSERMKVQIKSGISESQKPQHKNYFRHKV